MLIWPDCVRSENISNFGMRQTFEFRVKEKVFRAIIVIRQHHSDPATHRN